MNRPEQDHDAALWTALLIVGPALVLAPLVALLIAFLIIRP